VFTTPSESFVPSCYHSKGINGIGNVYLSTPHNHLDSLLSHLTLHYLCEGDDDDDNDTDESGDTDTWQPAPPSEAETPVSGGPSSAMSCVLSTEHCFLVGGSRHFCVSEEEGEVFRSMGRRQFEGACRKSRTVALLTDYINDFACYLSFLPCRASLDSSFMSAIRPARPRS